MAQNTTVFTYLDNSNEKSAVRIYNGPINAGTYAGYVTAYGALETALSAITLGTLAQRSVNTSTTIVSQTAPSDENAQRERKWLVTYQGDTSLKKFQMEIPTADLSGTHLLPNTDLADLTDADIAAFVTAFETIARSPDSESETVTVLSMRHVGRKS